MVFLHKWITHCSERSATSGETTETSRTTGTTFSTSPNGGVTTQTCSSRPLDPESGTIPTCLSVATTLLLWTRLKFSSESGPSSLRPCFCQLISGPCPKKCATFIKTPLWSLSTKFRIEDNFMSYFSDFYLVVQEIINDCTKYARTSISSFVNSFRRPSRNSGTPGFEWNWRPRQGRLGLGPADHQRPIRTWNRFRTNRRNPSISSVHFETGIYILCPQTTHTNLIGWLQRHRQRALHLCRFIRPFSSSWNLEYERHHHSLCQPRLDHYVPMLAAWIIRPKPVFFCTEFWFFIH